MSAEDRLGKMGSDAWAGTPLDRLQAMRVPCPVEQPRKLIHSVPLSMMRTQEVQAPEGARWLSVDKSVSGMGFIAWGIFDHTLPIRKYTFALVPDHTPCDDVEDMTYIGAIRASDNLGNVTLHIFVDKT